MLGDASRLMSQAKSTLNAIAKSDIATNIIVAMDSNCARNSGGASLGIRGIEEKNALWRNKLPMFQAMPNARKVINAIRAQFFRFRSATEDVNIVADRRRNATKKYCIWLNMN